jgi:hypothetical protein
MIFDRISNAEQARRPAVDRDEYQRLAVSTQVVSPARQRTGINRQLLEKGLVADGNVMPLDVPGCTPASARLKGFGPAQLEFFFNGRSRDGRSQGMLTGLFEAGHADVDHGRDGARGQCGCFDQERRGA